MLCKCKKATLAYSLLVAFCASPACLAQQNDIEDTDKPTDTQESRDMMKQSQMTVPELIKAGIIPDTSGGGNKKDEQDPYQQSPEEMQKQINAALGGRDYMPSSQMPDHQQYVPPGMMQPQKPQAPPQLKDPAAFAGPAPGFGRSAFNPVSPNQTASPYDSPQFGLPQMVEGNHLPAVPQRPAQTRPAAAQSAPPEEPKKSVTEGF